jgi:hypothetical protein
MAPASLFLPMAPVIPRAPASTSVGNARGCPRPNHSPPCGRASGSTRPGSCFSTRAALSSGRLEPVLASPLDESEQRPTRGARTPLAAPSTDAGVSARKQLTPARDDQRGPRSSPSARSPSDHRETSAVARIRGARRFCSVVRLRANGNS